VPYLSAFRRQGAIQIHVYLYLYLPPGTQAGDRVVLATSCVGDEACFGVLDGLWASVQVVPDSAF